MTLPKVKRHTPRIDHARSHISSRNGERTWMCEECGMPVQYRWRKAIRRDVPEHVR